MRLSPLAFAGALTVAGLLTSTATAAPVTYTIPANTPVVGSESLGTPGGNPFFQLLPAGSSEVISSVSYDVTIQTVASGVTFDQTGFTILLDDFSDGTAAFFSDSTGTGTATFTGFDTLPTPISATSTSGVFLELLAFNPNTGTQYTIGGTITVNDVPEPASLSMLGLGGLALLRRRRA